MANFSIEKQFIGGQVEGGIGAINGVIFADKRSQKRLKMAKK